MKKSVGILLLTVSMASISQGPIPQGDKASAANTNAKTENRDTNEPPLFVKVVPAPGAEKVAAEDKRDRQEKAESERSFALALIVIGFLQFLALVVHAIVFWVQARRLKETVRAMTGIASAEERRVKVLERAYVFAAPKNVGVPDPAGLERRYRLFVENFGRTPAIVKAVQWTLRPLKGLPAKPPYVADLPVHQVLHPNAPKTPTKADPVDYHTWDESHVIFGRVTYEDVFHRTHTSGFLYLIEGDEGEGFQHLSLDGYPKYLAWD